MQESFNAIVTVPVTGRSSSWLDDHVRPNISRHSFVLHPDATAHGPGGIVPFHPDRGFRRVRVYQYRGAGTADPGGRAGAGGQQWQRGALAG